MRTLIWWGTDVRILGHMDGLWFDIFRSNSLRLGSFVKQFVEFSVRISSTSTICHSLWTIISYLFAGWLQVDFNLHPLWLKINCWLTKLWSNQLFAGYFWSSWAFDLNHGANTWMPIRGYGWFWFGNPHDIQLWSVQMISIWISTHLYTANVQMLLIWAHAHLFPNWNYQCTLPFRSKK